MSLELRSTSKVVGIESRHGALPARRRGRRASQSASGQGAPCQVVGPRFASEPLEEAEPDLPRNGFIQQLRLEARRSERSGAPLTLIYYRLRDLDRQAGEDRDRLLETLYRCKRVTDLVGHVGDDICLLCTDTDAKGSRSLLEKINTRLGEPALLAEVATYPHDLFERLQDGTPGPAALEPFTSGERTNRPDPYLLKRPVDIVLTLVALALLWPLMLLIALAVRIDSPGPVLFRQQRLGRNGKPFWFLKFRSMRVGNDDSIHRAFVASLIKDADKAVGSGAASSVRYKLTADPRITRVGHFIRRTSMDELPQLFNVLRGDMSMVGPRPPIPYEAQQYRPWHLRRLLAIRPGITGLWQVEGRSRVTFDEMVRMDLRYIRECSLGLDVKLLLRTVLVVLRCDGAV